MDVFQVELFHALAQTVGVSGATILMVGQVKKLERLLEYYQNECKRNSLKIDNYFDRSEDLKYDLGIANKKNAQLQVQNDQLKAENRRLREALAAVAQDPKGGA